MPCTSAFRSTATGASGCLRAKASSRRTRSAPRSADCWISVRRRSSAGLPRPTASRSSSSALPMIVDSRLLKSCTMPAVRRPIAAIFSAWRSRCSDRWRAVTSAYSVTKPSPAIGLRRSSRTRPPGRSRSIVPVLPPERSKSIRRATSASTSTAPNSPASAWARRMSAIEAPTRSTSGGTPVKSGNRAFQASSRMSESIIMMPSLMPANVASSCAVLSASEARSWASAASRRRASWPRRHSRAASASSRTAVQPARVEVASCEPGSPACWARAAGAPSQVDPSSSASTSPLGKNVACGCRRGDAAAACGLVPP